jgi:hypothetical protein
LALLQKTEDAVLLEENEIDEK